MPMAIDSMLTTVCNLYFIKLRNATNKLCLIIFLTISFFDLGKSSHHLTYTSFSPFNLS